ncbi:MAG TPA: hypothetical protein VHL14_10590, partial [Steroidobacteraceae bacterium]|nr:hypothetical protein [Steroidobacteraceae bacterium]
MQQSSLFTETNVYPEGFSCQEDFLTRAFETKLLDHIRTLSFRDAPYKEWTAKRRIVSYGGSYDFT